MSPDAQRIAIAEACGWKNIIGPVTEYQDVYSRTIFCCPGLSGTNPDGEEGDVLPDYLNCLDAMHLAEEELDAKTYGVRRFLDALVDILQETHPNAKGHEEAVYYMIHATAAQRAEAFLKAMGKWEGGSE